MANQASTLRICSYALLVALFFSATSLFSQDDPGSSVDELSAEEPSANTAEDSLEKTTVPSVDEEAVSEQDSPDSIDEKLIQDEDVESAPDDAVEEPSPKKDEVSETVVKEPVTPAVPKKVFTLLDVSDDDFTARRIPGYKTSKKSQLIADIDEPILQTDEKNKTQKTEKKETNKISDDNDASKQAGKSREPGVIEGVVQTLGSDVKNWIGWGSLILLLGILIILYRMSNRKRKRRVFRKVPSNRR